MTETLANGYSSESTQTELSDEYQYDRVSMVIKKNLRILMLRTKVASALEGLRRDAIILIPFGKLTWNCTINRAGLTL